MQSSASVQPEIVVFDFDETLIRGNLNNFLEAIQESPFFDHCLAMDAPNELEQLKAKLKQMKEEALDTKKLEKQIKQLNECINNKIRKNARFGLLNYYGKWNIDKIWPFVDMQLNKEKNLPSEDQLLSPVSDPEQIKNLFVTLKQNNIYIGICSYNGYAPFVKHYLKIVIGLPDELVKGIMFQVAWPRKDANTTDKIQSYFLPAFVTATSNGNTNKILFIDDTALHTEAAKAKGYQAILADEPGKFLTEIQHYFNFLQNQVQVQIQPQLQVQQPQVDTVSTSTAFSSLFYQPLIPSTNQQQQEQQAQSQQNQESPRND